MSKGREAKGSPLPKGLPLVEVTHSYQFSAAHRLNNPRFSPAENARVYGRCNNPNGHGHTYRLEVTIRGPISSETGRVVGGPMLDEVVRTRIIQRFDRMDLDLLISPTDGPTSTTEVLAVVIWRLLDSALATGRLSRLRLDETPNNFFELNRDDIAHPDNPTAAIQGGWVEKASPA